MANANTTTTTNNTSELAKFAVLNCDTGARYEVEADSYRSAALEVYWLETGKHARFVVRAPEPGIFMIWDRVDRTTIPVGPDEGYHITRIDQ